MRLTNLQTVLFGLLLFSILCYAQEAQRITDSFSGRTPVITSNDASSTSAFESNSEAPLNSENYRLIFVPDEYYFIQDAIDASKDGDVIIIEEGTYYQQINFKGKAITVASRYFLDRDISHVSRTIIDGSKNLQKDSLSLVYFVNGEDHNSILYGLTLQNGSGTYGEYNSFYTWRSGGAVVIDGAGATISNNIIRDCRCISKNRYNGGAGIDIYRVPADRSVFITGNTIQNNECSGGHLGYGTAINGEEVSGPLTIKGNKIINNFSHGTNSACGGGISIINQLRSRTIVVSNYLYQNLLKGEITYGGGLFAKNLEISVYNNLIVENKMKSSGEGLGGGICIGCWDMGPQYLIETKIVNNTILDNYASDYGGGIFTNNIQTFTTNNIVRGNYAFSEKQLCFNSMPEVPEVSYSNIEGCYEGEGNIDKDPRFCNSTYCLLTSHDSPCIDAGNPDPRYDDLVNPCSPNCVLYPALGSKRNDMGHCGGPNSCWCNIVSQSTVEPAEQTAAAVNKDQCMMEQNYPNPFNPATKINYVIPSGVEGLVTLKVYSVLGREVATLVNETKEPGSYEVKFDGSDLPSGVYIYNLTIGNYSNTQKMILMK